MSPTPLDPGREPRWRRALSWLLVQEGSTRPLGLMRIVVACMVWARVGELMVVHSDSRPWQVGLVLAFHLSWIAMLLGAWSRLAVATSAAILVAGFVHLGPNLGPALGYYNWDGHNLHLLVCTVMVLAVTPSGQSYSLDRWWALRRAARQGRPAPVERAPLWSFRLLGLLVSTVYLSTWADKTTLPWLRGERLAAVFGVHYTGSAMPGTSLTDTVLMLGATGVWALEGLLAFGLALRRLRGPLALAGVVLHGSFAAMFRVFTFSVNMILLYVPFFPPDRIHAAIDDLVPTGDTPTRRMLDLEPTRRITRALCMIGVLVVLGIAAALDLARPLGPEVEDAPSVQLLEGRFDTFLRTAEVDGQKRRARLRSEMQRWRDP